MSLLDDKDFDKWCSQWDAALESGAFKKDDEDQNVPSPQTSDTSFFGLQNTHPTDAPAEDDSEYWKDVYKMSSYLGDKVESPEQMLHDSKVAQPVVTEGLQDKKSKFPPHPRQYDAKGVDQSLSPETLGVTFDEEDIKKLEQMKLQLYELEVKYNTAAANGESGQKIEQQIADLKKKFEEFSSLLNYGYPSDFEGAIKAAKTISGIAKKVNPAAAKMSRPHRFGPSLG
jgi:hypothetical protein